MYSNRNYGGGGFLTDILSMPKNLVILHPIITTTLLGVLVILVIYLLVKLSKKKGGFIVNRGGYGGTPPLWQLGSMDAGSGGSIDRPTRPVHMAAYNQDVRTALHSGMYEGYDSGGPDTAFLSMSPPPSPPVSPSSRAACKPGEVSVYDDSGNQVCVSTQRGGGVGYNSGKCSVPWDAAALAEAQALSTTGGFVSDLYGEDRLRSAISSVNGAPKVLSDEQLTMIMHQGAP